MMDVDQTEQILNTRQQRLLELLESLADGQPLSDATRSQLLSLLDAISRADGGIEFVFEHIDKVDAAGLFDHTVWERPDRLVPSLVKGSLLAGFPTNVTETLSELRMLSLAAGRHHNEHISTDEARIYLEHVVIANIELAFRDYSESERTQIPDSDRKRIERLFSFILTHIDVGALKNEMAVEISVLSEQRPIVTKPIEHILGLVRRNVNLTPDDEAAAPLLYYGDALYHPSDLSKKYEDVESYRQALKSLQKSELAAEARCLGDSMADTGLVAPQTVTLLKYLVRQEPNLVPDLLALNNHGRAEYDLHRSIVAMLVQRFISVDSPSAVYGLAKVLERTLLSRKPVINGLNALVRANLDPRIVALLSKRENVDDAHERLMCGMLSILGQPLGVGQGNNPTCQSARALSMWSTHAPGKLIDLVITAASANKLEFRFEGQIVSSTGLDPDSKFDLDLDPVSIVLVPHLDEIYGTMMQQAMMRHPGEDPHAWVNPAFYGHWIPSGFISCYSYLSNAIDHFERFARIFYAAFHPEYNGDTHLIYPIPVGIFITSSSAEMLGFHAVSLRRVEKDPSGLWRAYFFNPNNEGRQDWGQGIEPSVVGNGEVHGESSLPFYQFLARLYAFHYNPVDIEAQMENVPTEALQQVEKLARESWGRKYIWI